MDEYCLDRLSNHFDSDVINKVVTKTI
jgi:hypothetical protein